MTYVLDTHALIWLMVGDSRLGTTAHDVLSSRSDQQVIPAIVLAEISFLFQRRRIQVSFPAALAYLLAAPNTKIFPLDEAVVERLPGVLNIHDGIIVATALLIRDTLGEDVTIITKDREIVQSGLVKTVW